MELMGIDALKRLPHNSSSDIEAFEKQMQVLVGLAADRASSIHLLANFQELVSVARIERAQDEIGVIRQIAAALTDLRTHFRQSFADGSVELAQHRVAESLRKAQQDLDLVAGFLAR